MDALNLVWLYCPAARTDLFEKVMRAGADTVMFDLEDSVLPEQKDQARDDLSRFLASLTPDEASPRIFVRLNAIDAPWFTDDLAMIASAPGVIGVRLPKVITPDDIRSTAAALPNAEIHVAVETASGLARLDEICAAPDITSVALGEADLRASLRFEGDHAFDHLRVRLVCATAAAGKRPPMGSVYMNVRDDAGLLAHTRHLKSLGFLGRTAIHPRQIDVIRQAMRPSPEEVARAHEVLDAAGHGSGAFTLDDGQFVDAPVVRGAHETLAIERAVAARSAR